MIDALSSISSLGATRNLDFDTQLDASKTQQVKDVDETSFASTMRSAAEGVVDNLKTAEDMSYRGITGEATTREVVDAVMSAERSLQTALAIRDKVVSAYLEISKMPI